MNEYSSQQKKNIIFDIAILGDDENEKYFSKIFPILLNNSKQKFLFNFELFIRDEIKIPEDFINSYYPEFMDRLMNIDILILTFNLSNKLSFEYIKKFYYLYYNKFEEEDKPKNIILIDNEYISKGVENNASNELKKLFNENLYIYIDNEEKLVEILQECIKNLKKL